MLLFENQAVYEIMWKNTVEPGRPQMTIWSKRTAGWIPKATHIHSGHVILIAFSTATMVARMCLNVTFTCILTVLSISMRGYFNMLHASVV